MVCMAKMDGASPHQHSMLQLYLQAGSDLCWQRTCTSHDDGLVVRGLHQQLEGQWQRKPAPTHPSHPQSHASREPTYACDTADVRHACCMNCVPDLPP